ncbi:related to NOP9 - essential subunit of U3-containing 90S pre-ribosome [Ustilago sp. UG-2017a]|nr:related to NOP9 - essential subunit of U3-containing 90S pre-ribosome [Ustilago sp. UG-2017a]
MPPKVRQRGKKPSKQQKLQQEQEQVAEPVASSSTTSNPLQSQADFIPLNDDNTAAAAGEEEKADGTPNWVKLGDRPSKAEHEAPFGYVDAELKAYLRAGWQRVVELEAQGYVAKSTLTTLAAAGAGSHTNGPAGQGEEDDELALLLQATLKEMDGKELLLSTDPDTSLIVEGILHRLPAKPLRVFVDRLGGNFVTLSKHRFASHVIQACLSTLQPAVTLEHATSQHFSQHSHLSNANGKGASSAAYASDTATIVNEDGILRSATQLILDIAEELSADTGVLEGLVTDAFGSHVLRSLLCVMMGKNVQVDTNASVHSAAAADLRSRRSAKFRIRKAPTAVGGAPTSTISAEELLVLIPDLLFNRAAILQKEILAEASVDTIRRWATDAVASPLLQLLIEAETDSLNSVQDGAKWKGTLVDNLLNGFISFPPPNLTSAEEVQKDSYLETSLRDSVASHALQLALERCPITTASRFFSIYIRSRMAKLCVHPAANHIVAALIRRLSTDDLEGVLGEMGKVATGMVKEQMVGCILAAVERVMQLARRGEGGEELVKGVSEVVLAGFRLKSKEEEGDGLKLLVPAVLALKTRKAYLHTYAARLRRGDGEKGEERGSKRGRDGKTKTKGKKSSKKTLESDVEEDENPYTMDPTYELPITEATIQGSLLLQSLLRLPGPAVASRAPPKRTFGRPQPPATNPTPAQESWGCAMVLDSLLSLPTLVPFARNPTSVYFLISSLTHPSPSSPSPTAGLDWIQANRRRKLQQSLINTLPSYCGDKYGSRLADALWYTVDGYSKEKIVKTVIEHDTEILKMPYASYFTNKLQLQLWRKGKVREWTQAVQAQQQGLKKEEEKEMAERKWKPIIVETKRTKKENGKDGGKKKKDKVDGELDSILDQI